jgi:transposase-like protein
MQDENTRKENGKQIAGKADQIKRINDNWYQVKSQSLGYDSWYDVVATEAGFVCDCPWNQWKKSKCKHIFAVEFSLEIRKQVESFVIKQIDINCCKFCQSIDIIKKGLRKNKTYSLQVFKCQDCKRRFTVNLGFEKMKASPQVITSAIQLRFSGESLRNVQKFLELQGLEISHVTVQNWIEKYIDLMGSYLEKIKPNVGEKWRADELYFKAKGNPKYLYALMDDETRYWIAQQVSDKKYTDDITPMFREAEKRIGKKPTVLITDGARNFHDAWKKEYRQKNFLQKKTEHIRHIHIDGDKNNNKMERLNGEIRDREKVVRGLKKEDSSILEGLQIYHNYIRPHMGLNGKTPAEVAGIKVEGDNKWITLIQNARVSTFNTEKFLG